MEKTTTAQFRRNERLRRAVVKKDLGEAREMIARGGNAKQSPANGGLSLLAMAEDVAMARLLVEAGADPCAVNAVGLRPGEAAQMIIEAARSRGLLGMLPLGVEAVADYLEEEATRRMEKAALQASSPPVQMSDDASRARALAMRK